MSEEAQIASKRLTRRIAIAVLAATLLASAFAGKGAGADARPRCGEAGRAPSQLTMHQIRTSVLCLVNRAREREGLQPLNYNLDLRTSATQHSVDMVTHDYFAHTGPRGSTVGQRVERSGYLGSFRSYVVGENIGGGVGRLGSPLGVWRAWMHSPTHRANILDPSFHDFGVGVARGYPNAGTRDAATYTLDFGMRR